MADDAATINDAESDAPGRPDWRLVPGQRLADRFVIGGLLGTGAHGVVYRAYDERRRREVAVKVLLRFDPERIVRFKREFRILADVGDPRLVTLHELFVEPERVFFSMELVEGGHLLAWVREGGRLHEARLRSAMEQIARGLEVLHGSGRLHRDLKPTNVLVAKDGTIKLADFGLAMQLSRARETDEALDGVAGTPVYMSPEQAADLELSAATDWYSVGVILYEALTGVPPFEGLTGIPLMLAKQVGVDTPPRALEPDVPPDLDDLCMRLLAVDAAARPMGAVVIAMLRGEQPPLSSGAGRGPVPTEDQLFLGRRGELRDMLGLWEELARRRAGDAGPDRATALFLRGPSGIGKTSLVRNFVREVDQRATTLIVESRCYERESVPFKGLDGVVDSLWSHLAVLPHDQLLASVPERADALARVFPVLADLVRHQATSERRAAEDPIELRREAFRALRELLTRLARVRRLLVWIDDLQWCDADSADMIVELLRPPAPPGLFVVFTYRSEGEDRTPALGRVLELGALASEALAVELRDLSPLSEVEAVAVARSRGAGGPLAESIAREGEGNPLLVVELVRHYALRAGSGGHAPPTKGPVPTVEDVVTARVDRLPGDARALLEAVCVAGRPIAQGVASRAAEVDRAIESLTLLRTQHLLRTEGGAEEDQVDAYHDRVRVAVLRGLPEARARQRHLELARELEAVAADPVVLTGHLIAGGATERALTYAERSARRAREALAFNLAARLFRTALDLVPPSAAAGPARLRLLEGLGDALAHDGRPADAGPIFLEASGLAEGSRALLLRGRAADQLLRSGRVEEGSRELASVLAAVGLRLPSGPQAALVEFLWRRARIGVRGVAFDARAESEIPVDALLKVDLCWTAATSMSSVNLIMGQDLQALHLLLALDAGEPARVAKALAMETLYSATSGEPSARRTRGLLDDLRHLVDRVGSPQALAMERLATGAYWLYRGGFGEAHRTLREAERMLRTACSDVTWELNMARTLWLQSMFFEGAYGPLASAAERALEDAIARDNRHDESLLRVAYGPLSRLIGGDEAAARRQLEACLDRGHAQFESSTWRYILMLTASRLERYAGRGVAAWATFEENWGLVERSLMLSVQPSRIIAYFERANTALAAAHELGGREREAMLTRAERFLRRVERERSSWGGALAELAGASIDAARGRALLARGRLEHAETELLRGGMRGYASMARRRRGELMGGQAGASLVAEADAALREAGARAPAAIADMLVPPVLAWQ